MPPQPWPIVVDGLYGDVPNGFYAAQDTSQQMVLLPFGGLKKLCQFPNCTEIRAAWSWNDFMYYLARRGSQSILFRTDDTGAYTEIGTVTTSYTGPAWMRNNQTQLCVVDGVTRYVFTPAQNLFQQIIDPNYAGCGTLEYQDSYGLITVPNTNQWFFTSPNDFTTSDPNDFYTKEARTDNVRSIRSLLGLPYIFGTELGTEEWYNAGGDNSTAQNPTFRRTDGGFINYALGSPRGDCDMDGTAIVIYTTGGQLVKIVGTQAQVVSNQMFDRAVAGDGTPENTGYAVRDDVIAFSYRDQGHIFGQFTFPSQDVTWIVDGTTNLILKKQSYKAGGGYGRHRANCYCLFKKKHYVGDFEDGTVYEMSSNYFDDAGHTIQRILYSQNGKYGMSLTSFPNVMVMIQPGQGLPGGVAPMIGLEFSGDDGKTWSNMVSRSVGLTGEYAWQALWNQMGAGYNRMYRATMTDPILWRINGIDFGLQ